MNLNMGGSYFRLLFTVTFLSVQLGILHCKDAKIDSLKQILATTSKDSIRYFLCREIGDSYYEGNFDSLLTYYHHSLELARKLGYTREEISTLRSFAYVYKFRKNDYEKAAFYFQKTLALTEEKKDSAAQVYILNDLGELYRDKGDRVNAIDYLFKANQKAEQIGHKHILSRTWYSLGLLYSEKGAPEEALFYFQKALPLTEGEKYKRMRGSILNSIGETYQEMNIQEEAKSAFDEALSLFKQLDDNDLQVEVYYNMAKGKTYNQQYQQAIEHYATALQLNEIVENKNRKAEILVGLATAYLDYQDYEKAHATALEGMDIIKKIDTKLHKKELAEILSTTFAKKGNYKRAFDFSQVARFAEDSLKSIAANKKLVEVSALYEQEKATSEIEQLRAESAEKQLLLSKSRFRMLLIGFLIVLFLGIVFLWQLQRERNSI